MATRAKDYSALTKDERRMVFFARWANHNTVCGGMSALIAAEAQENSDALDAVGATYSRSTGKPAAEFDAWECDECGSVHFGQDAANACCAELYYEEEEEE